MNSLMKCQVSNMNIQMGTADLKGLLCFFRAEDLGKDLGFPCPEILHDFPRAMSSATQPCNS